MSVFAGILAMEAGAHLGPGTERILRTQLSRRDDEEVQIRAGVNHVIGYVELGLMPGNGLFDLGPGGFALLSGDPCLAKETREPGLASRQSALQILHEDWLADRRDRLRMARGDYCSLHFDAASHTLSLCCDRLGMRPVYFAVDGGCLVFATSLRMMLALRPALGLRPDLVGQLQVACYGFCLGERTPFESIRLLAPASMLTVKGSHWHIENYADWLADTQVLNDDVSELQRLQSVFSAGVRLRLDGQRSVIAQLSGGLDSRCVVAGLRQQGAEVYSINFSPPGSADLALGRLAAQVLGTDHLEVTDGPISLEGRSVDAHRRLLDSLSPQTMPDRPQVIWSGFGGETVLSQPEMSPELLEALEAGELDRAVEIYLQLMKVAFPRHIFRADPSQALESSLHDSVAERWRSMGTPDLVHAFNLFRALDNIRGPLRNRYEDRDIKRVVYVNPLCDPDFVATALSMPVRSLLRHRLYYRWLATFSLPVDQVPWQAYPDSDPCPIPLPEGLRNQWDGGWHSPEDMAENRRIELARLMTDLRCPHFPDKVLNRKMLWVAHGLGWVGIHRYKYLLSAASPFVRFARMAAEADSGQEV